MANRDNYSISMMCRVFGVSRDGFNSWRRRGESQRNLNDKRLFGEINEVFLKSGKLYGSPKIHEALKVKGIKVSRKRIARIMRENGLRARVSTLYYSNPNNHAFFTSIPNRQLEVLADECDKVWVGDLTYIKLGTDFRYLAVVLDKCSRRVIGWSYGKRKTAELTLKALKHAIRNRGVRQGLIFHSDRGAEYAAYSYQEKLAKHGVTQSMNRPGKMNDNAHMESFFHNFKAERVHKKHYHNDESLRRMIIEYVNFYNQRRLHSAIGYVTPAEFECNVI